MDVYKTKLNGEYSLSYDRKKDPRILRENLEKLERSPYTVKSRKGNYHSIINSSKYYLKILKLLTMISKSPDTNIIRKRDCPF